MFDTFLLNRSGVITATAKGHATDVLREFHCACAAVLSNRGPWRIIKVEGKISDSATLDSEMTWSLKAKLK